MPYEGEFAGYQSLWRIAESERVKNLLQRAKIRNEAERDVESLPQIQIADVVPAKWQPDLVIAIDGSSQSSLVETGYPLSEVGYVTVASVFLDLARMRELDVDRPIDPKELRETEKSESIDAALPSCNVVVEGQSSAKASLRKELYEIMKEVCIFEGGESLLETYEALLAYKPNEREQTCPYSGLFDNGCAAPQQSYRPGFKQYECECRYHRPLYSTDALRIHEGFHYDNSNEELFSEVRNVLERLWMVHLLRNLEKFKWLATLRNVAIFVDGPLAVFGRPAWLSHSIKKELQRINAEAKQYTDGQDLLLVGIEKSGAFVKHLEQIARTKDGKPSFPPQTAILLTDDYIKRNIIFSESTRPYGHQTYFGRKFFYQTASGAFIVATLPFLEEWQQDITSATVNQHPRLADAMGLLDQLVSSRYPNSLAPIISANREAAIPLNLGKRVLEQMARRYMQEG
jgi:hypothetical protein